jgi:hypothetical protein
VAHHRPAISRRSEIDAATPAERRAEFENQLLAGITEGIMRGRPSARAI